jgi:hypothetical protein
MAVKRPWSLDGLVLFLLVSLLVFIPIFLLPGSVFANPIPAGACCLRDETCDLLSEQLCAEADGVYQGDFTMCEPNSCVWGVGACCLPDSSCQVMDATACEDGQGVSQGQFTTCSPCNPCETRIGRCCFGESCSMLAGSDCCAGHGWFYLETTCEEHPCATPVRPTSWGWIKSMFR